MECLTNDGPCSRNFTPCQFLSEEPLAFGTGNRRLHARGRMERLATRPGQKRCFASCGIVVGRCLGSSTGGLGLRNYITSPKLTSEQPQRFIWGSADAETHCEGPLLGEIHEQIHASSSPQKGLSHVSMGWLTVGRRTLDETIRLFSDLSPYVPILSIDDFLIFKFLLRKVLFLFFQVYIPYHRHYNPLV